MGVLEKIPWEGEFTLRSDPSPLSSRMQGSSATELFSFSALPVLPLTPPRFRAALRSVRAAQRGSGLMYRLSPGGLEGEAGSELVFQWAYIRVRFRRFDHLRNVSKK